MGNESLCCKNSGDDDIPLPIRFHFDNKHKMASSYQQNQKIFKKLFNNWHSIPVKVTGFCFPSYFKIKNCGIKNQWFLVGVIKKEAIQKMKQYPWRTSEVICFESHKNKNQSAIVYNNKPRYCGRGVKQDEVIKVTIRQQKIEFNIEDELIAETQLPKDFQSTKILPYVALFNQNDKIQFIE